MSVTTQATDPTSIDPQPSDPEAEDLLAIAREVWVTFLDAEIPLVPAIIPASRRLPVWSGSVIVSGAWSGFITVSMSTPLARAAAAELLDTQDPTETDVADAMGELANMLGGGVKGILPGPSTLSLPLVAEGRMVHRGDATEVCRLDSEWQGQPLSIVIDRVDHAPVRDPQD